MTIYLSWLAGTTWHDRLNVEYVTAEFVYNNGTNKNWPENVIYKTLKEPGWSNYNSYELNFNLWLKNPGWLFAQPNLSLKI